MERVYPQRNPDGGNLLVVYVEAGGGTADVIGALAASGSDFDRWFLDVSQEITGIDFRQSAPGSGPEHVAGWEDPGGGRGAGLAFVVPLLPGKAEALRGWAREAFGSRRQELTGHLRLGWRRPAPRVSASGYSPNAHQDWLRSPERTQPAPSQTTSPKHWRASQPDA